MRKPKKAHEEEPTSQPTIPAELQLETNTHFWLEKGGHFRSCGRFRSSAYTTGDRITTWLTHRTMRNYRIYCSSFKPLSFQVVLQQQQPNIHSPNFRNSGTPILLGIPSNCSPLNFLSFLSEGGSHVIQFWPIELRRWVGLSENVPKRGRPHWLSTLPLLPSWDSELML